MNILRLVTGVILGLFLITLVAESAELITVKLLSGQPFDYLRNNQEEYFAIRNQGGVLSFKMICNLLAAVIGGYIAAWIAKEKAEKASIALIVIQSISLIWAGFFSELSSTGPMWMWIMLILITPVGIFVGYKLRSK